MSSDRLLPVIPSLAAVPKKNAGMGFLQEF
jgi:hypothetical protein